MAERWSDTFSARVRAWSDHVAALAVDELVCAGMVRMDQLQSASDVVAEEIFVRLCLLDYPPVPDSLETESATK